MMKIHVWENEVIAKDLVVDELKKKLCFFFPLSDDLCGKKVTRWVTTL